jgi:integrase/recombinase XerD
VPRRKKVYPFIDEHDPRGLVALMRLYADALLARGSAPRTVDGIVWSLSHFVLWTQERAVTRAAEVTKPMIDRYQRHLFHYRSEAGRPISLRTQHQRLGYVQRFFRWLSRNNYLLANPAADIELPRLPERLPRDVLTVEETERILAVPDLTTPFGLRDRVILELLYSTGIRRSEIAHLRNYDLDFSGGTLLVREGKGKKDRRVPLGERAIAWLDKYLSDVRPDLAIEPDDGALFLSYKGTGLHLEVIGDIVRRTIDAAGITKQGACHMFRHTAATLMLENGADIRFIQEFLGHAKLDTTQIYTRVSIQKLKQIHAATHPGAKLERLPDRAAVEALEADGTPEPSR